MVEEKDDEMWMSQRESFFQEAENECPNFERMEVTKMTKMVAFYNTDLCSRLGNNDLETKLSLLVAPPLAGAPLVKAYSQPTVDWG